MLFAYSRHPTLQLRNFVSQLPKEKKQEIINTYIGNRQSKRDRPERALEYGYPIRFEIIGGFAEYRDLQRHRMLTQQRQELGVDLGYSIPEEVEEIGFLGKAQECFGRAEHLHSELKHAGFKQEAQYAALFNHFIRWYMAMNPRELEHLTELRAQKAGHPRYRRVAQNMAKMYLAKHPEMEPLLHYVDYNDYDDKIARAEAEAKSAYKSLVTHVENKADE
jgi:thymidylate synthase ThyX